MHATTRSGSNKDDIAGDGAQARKRRCFRPQHMYLHAQQVDEVHHDGDGDEDGDGREVVRLRTPIRADAPADQRALDASDGAWDPVIGGFTKKNKRRRSSKGEHSLSSDSGSER